MSQVKTCYWTGCTTPTIKAHSISNSKLLLKIAESGHVMYMNTESEDGEFSLRPTGRAKATTFPGFCGTHDKMFHPVDIEDYNESIEHNFLFAFRAAAKEYINKLAADVATEELLKESLNPLYRRALEAWQEGSAVAIADNEAIRKKFCDLYSKGKFNALNSVVFVLPKELPVVASACFQVELDGDGNLVNDLSNQGLDEKVAPLFMTLFPQNRKTYCILSFFKSDRKKYRFLANYVDKNETEKEVLISNLLLSYTENFAMKPSFWDAFTEAEKVSIEQHFMDTLMPEMRKVLIYNPELNLFDRS